MDKNKEIIGRESYLERIRPFIDTDLIKVITGIRRCGKSAMLELVRQELPHRGVSPNNIFSFNFEDMENNPLRDAAALYDHIKKLIAGTSGKTYLFMDEIQEVAEWERCVNSLRAAQDTDIYITGSNAALLSGELATYIGGRYVEIQMLPFSFAEFTGLHELMEPGLEAGALFKKYVDFGGMPFLHNLSFQEAPCYQYLKDIYHSVVLKDIIQRGHIRDADLLERIIVYIMAHIGQPFSATSISNFFKNERRAVSPETILNYLKACEDAFLFYRVKRRDLAGKKILRVYEKYYLADHGLREAVYGKKSRNIGMILENMVYLELLRRGYDVTVGKLYDTEIDFVCENSAGLAYIQVAYLLTPEETAEREFAPLRRIRDNFPKLVLSLDEFDMSREGIRHQHIRDFLGARGADSFSFFQIIPIICSFVLYGLYQSFHGFL